MLKGLRVLACCLALTAWSPPAPANAPRGATLAAVADRGAVRCGVDAAGRAGFAERDAEGRWRGFDIDYCRAVAAAVLGDGGGVDVVPLAPADRLDALARGEIDLLAHGTAWTFSRDMATGIAFVAVTYFDGQGFMVPREPGIRSAFELDGARVCVPAATTAERDLVAFFAANSMELEVVRVADGAGLQAAYGGGACDAVTGDLSRLAAVRHRLADPEAHLILPDVISKEPLALVVREDDPTWADVVRWTHFALLRAEELALGADDVTSPERRERPAVRAFVAGTRTAVLPEGWAVDVVHRVGHYGEIFARHFGEASELGLDRGLNGLWIDGGLHYPMPFR